jgi:hypothetical protein
MGMNSNEAIRAHSVWKERFRISMAKRSQLNVADITSDKCCDFGKWLHGDAKALYGSLANYAACVVLHEAFHQEAGKVAQRINDGNFVAAEQMLAFGTPYAKASEALGIGVVEMFKEAGEWA